MPAEKVEECNSLYGPLILAIGYYSITTETMLQSLQRTPYLSHAARPLCAAVLRSNISTIPSFISRVLWGTEEPHAIKTKHTLTYSELEEMFKDSRKIEHYVAEAAAVNIIERLRRDAKGGHMHLWDSYTAHAYVKDKPLLMSNSTIRPFINTMGRYLPKELLIPYDNEVAIQIGECRNKANSMSGSMLTIGDVILLMEQSEAKGKLVMHERACYAADWAIRVIRDWRARGVLHLSTGARVSIDFPFRLSSEAIREFGLVLRTYIKFDFITVERTLGSERKIDVILNLDKARA